MGFLRTPYRSRDITTVPPSGGGGGTHPNQPAGFTQLRFHSFDTVEGPDFYDASSVPGSGAYIVVSDPTNPGSSASVGRMQFDPGLAGGTAPASLAMRTPFSPGRNTLYLDCWLKLSSNWIQPEAGQKVFFTTLAGTGGSQYDVPELGNWGFDHDAGTNLQPIQPFLVPHVMQVTGVVDYRPGIGTADLGENQQPYNESTAALVQPRTTWSRYEVLWIMNTPGNADGGLMWWWNGLVFGDYRNRIQWNDSGAGFDTVRWEPTYGGSLVPPPVLQYFYMKDLYLSG